MFSAVQWQQAEEPSLLNKKADRLMKNNGNNIADGPLDNALNLSWP